MGRIVRGGVRAWIRGHPLTSYILLAFIFAWAVWLPMAAASRGLLEVSLPVLFVYLGGIAPVAAATLVELLARGQGGLRSLYGRFILGGVRARWYLAAGLLPLGFGVLASLLRSIAAGTRPAFPPPLALLSSLVQGVLLVPIAAFEEVGWRGFALPRLQERHSPLVSSLLLGAVWAVWHAPLWLLRGIGYDGMNPTLWTLEVLAASTLITWLFNGGGGSLWIPCLYHAASNMAVRTFVSPDQAGAYSVFVLAAAATVAVVANLPRRRSVPCE